MDFLSLGGVGETKSLLLPPAVSGCSRPIREGTISDKPEGRRAYRIATLALDIVGLIDATGRDRAAVVGHDWGGAIAWWLATYHGDRVRRVAVLNCPIPWSFPASCAAVQLSFCEAGTCSSFNSRGCQKRCRRGELRASDPHNALDRPTRHFQGEGLRTLSNGLVAARRTDRHAKLVPSGTSYDAQRTARWWPGRGSGSPRLGRAGCISRPRTSSAHHGAMQERARRIPRGGHTLADA